MGVALTIEATADGVVARYHLDHPISRFSFEYQGGKQRDGYWTLRTPGMTFDAYDVRSDSGAQFDSFEVAVSIRNEVTDAIYPALLKIGPSGRVIYLSYFVGKQDRFRTRLQFSIPDDHVLLGLRDQQSVVDVGRSAYGQAGSIYVYLGPRTNVHRTPYATFVAGPEAPTWILAEIENSAERSLKFFTGKTHVPLKRSPLFLITSDPGTRGRRSLQADVTEGPNVAFRFFGVLPERNDVDVESIHAVVPHETAHFWNGHLFQSKDEDKSPWLHEGGANYWAYLERRRFEHIDQKDIENALNGCVQKLGTQALSKSSGADYECGETLEWLADIGLRRRGRDIFDLWRDMFAQAESNGSYYSVAMFRSLAERTSLTIRDAFRLVLDQTGTDRWQRLPALLVTLGVLLEFKPPSADHQRSWAIMHVLARSCGHGSRGFWLFEDHIKFNTGDRCGGLSGDPEADAVNGHNLFTETDAAYAAVDDACKNNGSLSFTRKGSDKAYSVRCDSPLPPLPPQFRIVSGD